MSYVLYISLQRKPKVLLYSNQTLGIIQPLFYTIYNVPRRIVYQLTNSWHVTLSQLTNSWCTQWHTFWPMCLWGCFENKSCYLTHFILEHHVTIRLVFKAQDGVSMVTWGTGWVSRHRVVISLLWEHGVCLGDFVWMWWNQSAKPLHIYISAIAPQNIAFICLACLIAT